ETSLSCTLLIRVVCLSLHFSSGVRGPGFLVRNVHDSTGALLLSVVEKRGMHAGTASPAHPHTTEHLTGAVERVTFHSEETGFCVLRVKVRGQRDLVTVVGTAATITPGEYIETEGWWVTDRTHGLQFKTHALRVVPPSTLEGIEKYLASGMVKGIGPHFARKLVQAFGEQVFDVIEQTPARLTDLDGIGPKRQQRIVAAWDAQKMIRAIMVFLHSHGIGTA